MNSISSIGSDPVQLVQVPHVHAWRTVFAGSEPLTWKRDAVGSTCEQCLGHQNTSIYISSPGCLGHVDCIVSYQDICPDIAIVVLAQSGYSYKVFHIYMYIYIYKFIFIE